MKTKKPKSADASSVPRIAKIVVYSDLCYSTKILEDLLQSESHHRWRRALIKLKEFLRQGATSERFSIYKFIGDGWILLFEPDTEPVAMFRFLRSFAREYDRVFREVIEPVLSSPIYGTGMTFGMDRGTLVRLVMNGKEEFIGRPLNVAARLQAAVKEGDYNPQNKVLMTASLYGDIKDALGTSFRVEQTARKLRNVGAGKDFRCHKLYLFKD